MRTMITGGAGFIGSYLSEELKARGNQVSIVDNLFRGNIENIKHLIDQNNYFYNIDLADSESIKKLEDILLREKPSIIFHYAAINGTQYFYDIPQLVLENNTIMTINLLKAIQLVIEKSKDYQPKIVYASSSEVYGEPINVPTNEKDITHINTYEVRDSYALSKLNGEFFIKLYSQKYNFDYLIFRLFNVYGPRMIGTKYGQVIPEFIYRLKSGEYPLNIYGNGSHTRSFCFVKDNVNISIDLSIKVSNDTINIGSPYEISIKELAETIMSKLDLKPAFNYLKERSGDHKRRNPDISRMISLLGNFNFISLEEGLKNMLKNYKG